MRFIISRAFHADEKGGVAVFMALMMPIFAGMAALAVEYGLWLVKRSDMQRVADAAAYSSALSLSKGASSVQGAAARVVQRQYPKIANTLQVHYPPISGSHQGSSTHIEVSLSETIPRFLSQLFVSGDQTVTTRAVAGYNVGSEACFMSTSTSASVGIKLNGTLTVNSKGCGLTSNSGSSTSIDIEGAKLNLSNSCVNAAGTVDGNTLSAIQNNASCAQANLNSGVVTDPYSYIKASLPNPATLTFCESSTDSQPFFSPSDWPVLSFPFQTQLGYRAACISGGMWYAKPYRNPWTKATGNPDVYENYSHSRSQVNTLIVNGGTLRLGPGQYFWEETTILLLNGADFVYEGDYSQLRLRAPTSGPFAGFAIIGTPGSSISVTGELNFSLSGIVYAPDSDINITGTNWSGVRFDTIWTPDYTREECAQFVGGTINWSGKGIYNLTCNQLLPGMKRLTASTPVRLAE